MAGSCVVDGKERSLWHRVVKVMVGSRVADARELCSR